MKHKNLFKQILNNKKTKQWNKYSQNKMLKIVILKQFKNLNKKIQIIKLNKSKTITQKRKINNLLNKIVKMQK